MLASTVFTSAAVLLVLLVTIRWREQLADPVRLLSDEQFRTANQVSAFLDLALVSVLACGLAAAVHVFLARKSSTRLYVVSGWKQVFVEQVPANCEPYVRVKTTTGSVYCGYVVIAVVMVSYPRRRDAAGAAPPPQVSSERKRPI